MEEKHRHEEKEKGKKGSPLLWWGIAAVLIVIAFFAVRYFSEPDINPYELPEGEEELYYNNFRFVKIDGLWYTQWQKNEKLYTIPLRFNPYEVEDMPVEGTLNFTLFNTVRNVYVTFDLSDEDNSNFTLLALASAEFSQNLVKAINRQPTAACTNNQSSACKDRPIVSCDNKSVPIVFIREQGPAKAILDDNCMIIQGEGMDLLKAIDRVLYSWYGIIV